MASAVGSSGGCRCLLVFPSPEAAGYYAHQCRCGRHAGLSRLPYRARGSGSAALDRRAARQQQTASGGKTSGRKVRSGTSTTSLDRTGSALAQSQPILVLVFHFGTSITNFCAPMCNAFALPTPVPQNLVRGIGLRSAAPDLLNVKGPTDAAAGPFL